MSNTANDTAGAPVASPGTTVSEAGSSLLYPLMVEWATNYQQQFPNVTVTPAAGGSSAGIADASAGTKDIGASDAYLSTGDLLKNPELLNIPLAVSAQSVIYNLPGLRPAGAHIRLTGANLADMYNGIITTWNDPSITSQNPGITIPPLPVVPVHRMDGSGDTFIFTSYLSTQNLDWNTKVGYGTKVAWPAASTVTANGSNGPTGMPQLGMIDVCAAHPGCLGYNGVSYLSKEEPKGIGEAALENTGGQFTIPSPATIQAELGYFVPITPDNETISMIAGPGSSGYPIINFEYAIVRMKQPSAAKAQQVKDFLNWTVSNSKALSLVGSVGFQPLPPEIQALSQQQIARIH